MRRQNGPSLRQFKEQYQERFNNAAPNNTIMLVVVGKCRRYRGKNCEENIDDCPGNLCQNGATCVDDINRYSCLCPPTYMGELCEQDVDECGQRPSVCQNGATCTNSIGGFSCICVNGWAGADCSVNIDDCAGAACFNGATCIDRVGSFYCRCTPGKTGELEISFKLSTASSAIFFRDEVMWDEIEKSKENWEENLKAVKSIHNAFPYKKELRWNCKQ
ncbi:hypothetical protein ANN_26234 [Periplaneta americana]|uniref:EGF-like domain-containing protein n=1 Tax=Periplaneta americana TaxID=6978 RepID=A0ABQ8S5Y7_PERAM|nr:hypothetical protein ANN_26234 [Periplaneta americana]